MLIGQKYRHQKSRTAMPAHFGLSALNVPIAVYRILCLFSILCPQVYRPIVGRGSFLGKLQYVHLGQDVKDESPAVLLQMIPLSRTKRKIAISHRLQFPGIDVFVPIQYCPAFTIRPYFSTFVQKNIIIMRVKYHLPESCPVVTCPHIETLKVTQNSNAPSWQRK